MNEFYKLKEEIENRFQEKMAKLNEEIESRIQENEKRNQEQIKINDDLDSRLDKLEKYFEDMDNDTGIYDDNYKVTKDDLRESLNFFENDKNTSPEELQTIKNCIAVCHPDIV